MNDLILEKGPSREVVKQMEQHMLRLPQLDIPPQHHFAEGLYARQIDIPADTLLTGRAHKFGHLNVLAKGVIAVSTDEGMRLLEAPAVIHGKAGVKRVGYAVTDCTWITFHATPLTDVEELESTLFDPVPLLEMAEEEA